MYDDILYDSSETNCTKIIYNNEDSDIMTQSTCDSEDPTGTIIICHISDGDNDSEYQLPLVQTSDGIHRAAVQYQCLMFHCVMDGVVADSARPAGSGLGK